MTATESAVNFQLLSIDALHESARNPRRHYDEAKLQDLANSMREHGILTPLLVRPNATMRTRLHEIAAGHRRYRAAKLAGIDHIPCIIREMDDDAFLEVLTIENLQREDVHPLEEAEGFGELLKRPGYSIEVISEKLGKPVGYVSGRLQLLTLADDVRSAFLNNSITIGHARALAQLDHKQQVKFLAEDCFDYHGDLATVKGLKRAIAVNSGRDLASAPFALDVLIQGVKGQSPLACTNCVRAVGVNPLLIDEDGQKLCLDPNCFDAKLDTHIAQLTKAGLVAISSRYSPKDAAAGALAGAEFEEIHADDDDEDLGQLQSLQDELKNADLDPDERAATEQELKDLQDSIAEHQTDCGHSEPAIYVDGHSRDKGKQTRICRAPECPVHGKMLAAQSRSSSSKADTDKYKAEEAKRRLKERIDRETNRRLWLAIVDKAPFDTKVVGERLIEELRHDGQRELCAVLGIDGAKAQYGTGKDFARPLKAHFGKLKSDKIPGFILGLALLSYHYRTDQMRAIAKEIGIDLKSIESQAKLAVAPPAKAAKKPKAKKADAPPKPSVKAKDRKRAAANDEDDE